MRRRNFIAGIGSGAAAAWPLSLRAQQNGRQRTIGVLMGVSESDTEGQARITAFRRGLEALWWTDGQNVKLDIRWGDGDGARIRALAGELATAAHDVILGTNTPTVRALKAATKTVPVVFAGLSDPVGDGIVESLARPGGNITGFSSFDSPLAGKWLQYLIEIQPKTKRVTVMFNPDTAPHSLFLPILEAAARQMSVPLVQARVRDVAAVETTIAALAGESGQALVVLADVFSTIHRGLIISLAERHRVPAIYPGRYFVTDGGLICYGSDFADQYRRAASYVDRILQGMSAGDLPVQAPIKFELAINLKTAKAIGIEVPLSLLATADEVIE